MFAKCNHMSGLQALAARWRILGLLAVAFAREVLSLKRRGAPDAIRKAEILEAWLFAAIIQISEDVKTHAPDAETLSDTDAEARHYLNVVYTYLMILALFVRQLASDMRVATEAFAALIPAMRIWHADKPDLSPAPTPFLDSG